MKYLTNAYIALAEDFVLYGVSAAIDSLVVIDTTNAEVSVVGPLGFDVERAGGLTFDPDGVLWLVSDNHVYIAGSGQHRALRGQRCR